MTDEIESNNSLDAANTVSLNTAVNGQLSSAADIDFFGASITATGVLSVYFSTFLSETYSSYYVVSVYNSVGVLLFSRITGLNYAVVGNHQTEQNYSFDLGIQAPGSYYVSVASSSSYDAGQYSVSISPSAGGQSGFESEFNGAWVAANSLPFASPISGQLSSKSDVDFYSVAATASGVLHIAFDSPISSRLYSYFAISVYDGLGNQLISRPTGQDILFDVGVSAPGNYYVSIAAIDNVHGYPTSSYFVSAPYGLNITEGSSAGGDFENEVNDSRSTATALALNNTIQGKISSYDDVDYYGISVTAPGILTLSADVNVVTSLYFIGSSAVISVFDASGNLLSSWRGSGHQVHSTGISSAGTYYVSIANSGGYYEDGDYRLTATATAGSASAYEGELNDTTATASQLTLGVAIQGQLSSQSDIDYYSATLLSSGILNLSFSPPDIGYIHRTSYSISVFDSVGTLLAHFEPGSGFSCNIGAPLADTYYVSVSTSAGHGYSNILQDSYSLVLTASAGGASGYENESNNTQATANDLALGSVVAGQLYSTDDIDYFKVQTNSAGALTVDFHTPVGDTNNNYFKVKVYDGSGTQLTAWTTTQDTAWQVVAANPGQYYVSIGYLVDGACDNQPYSVQVSATTDDWSDDYAGSVQTAGIVTVVDTSRIDAVPATPTSGVIDISCDSDWLRVESLVAGMKYSIELTGYTGYGSPPDRLSNPILQVFDSEGTLVQTIDGSGDYGNEIADFIPLTNGTYYLAANGTLGNVGKYSVAVSLVDDFSASIATVGSLPTTGMAVAGRLDTRVDTDWFRVALQEGQTYLFSVDGPTAYLGGYDLNLGVHFANGAQLEFVDDNPLFPSGVTVNPELAFTAPLSGEYFVSVGGTRHDDGPIRPGYTLKASLQSLQSSVDALVSGYWWLPVSPSPHNTILTYSFLDDLPAEDVAAYKAVGSTPPVFNAFTAAQRADVASILESWSAVADVTFTEVPSAIGQIRFGWLTDDPYILDGAAAITAWNPVSQTSTKLARADIALSSSYYSSAQDPVAGDSLYWALVHEIGHALSLDHTTNYGDGSPPPYLPMSLDSKEFSVMSYIDRPDSSVFSAKPGLIDIAAAQYLYGANTKYHAGNDSYAFPEGTEYLTTIWDSGGIDTVDASGQTSASTIFLESGTLSSIGATAAGTGAHDNVAIAFGAQIENAKGGSGNDFIVGNSQNNSLTGNAGNDTLIGGGGSDTAQYSGMFRQYQLTGATIATATLAGPDGTDSLSGIEKLVFVDGSMNYDPYAHVAQVSRLYETTLGRLPDPGGLNNWVAQLEAGTALSDAALGFTGSHEFQNSYGSLDNTQFVNQLYLNVLQRPADPVGLSSWVGYLDGGTSRGDVVVGFSESQENINNHAAQTSAGIWEINETAGTVARLYWGTLARAPEAAGLENWVNALNGGMGLGQVAGGFTGSQEFQNIYGSLNNTQFVNQLYLNVLERAADPGGLAYWLNALDGGTSRGDIAWGFTESTEYQIKMIGMIDHGITIV